jgi:hypothetical protein
MSFVLSCTLSLPPPATENPIKRRSPPPLIYLVAIGHRPLPPLLLSFCHFSFLHPFIHRWSNNNYWNGHAHSNDSQRRLSSSVTCHWWIGNIGKTQPFGHRHMNNHVMMMTTLIHLHLLPRPSPSITKITNKRTTRWSSHWMIINISLGPRPQPKKYSLFKHNNQLQLSGADYWVC